jgi:hypothetical protein
MRSFVLVPKDHPMSSSITFRRRLSPYGSVNKRLRHLIPCVLLAPPAILKRATSLHTGRTGTEVSISSFTSPRSQSPQLSQEDHFISIEAHQTNLCLFAIHSIPLASKRRGRATVLEREWGLVQNTKPDVVDRILDRIRR